MVSNKPSASGLHGGVVKMGRVVSAKELKYLHANVDSNTDGWGALISTNRGDGCGPPSPTTQARPKPP